VKIILAAYLGIVLIELTDPDHDRLEMNAVEFIKLHDITDKEIHAEGTKCLINTADGKSIAVLESCSEVHRLIIDQIRDRLP
jgi:hypothetical protein